MSHHDGDGCELTFGPGIHNLGATPQRPVTAAAVPDPLRDQLADVVRADLCRVPRVWTGDLGPGEIAELVADLPAVGRLIAAEVEARVQATAKQQVAEERARWITALGVLAARHSLRWFALEVRNRAAALAQPDGARP